MKGLSMRLREDQVKDLQELLIYLDNGEEVTIADSQLLQLLSCIIHEKLRSNRICGNCIYWSGDIKTIGRACTCEEKYSVKYDKISKYKHRTVTACKHYTEKGSRLNGK